MTKDEVAFLKGGLKVVWSLAVYRQEAAKNPALTDFESIRTENKAKLTAAHARGYREACIDLLNYSFDDGLVDAECEVQRWIDEVEFRSGAKLGIVDAY
ncbi:hypothetical protein [Megasphaera sp.]|uniref:hypothetical protein n=1 Tax=Megasphaera sp. TaxID=2023260 RepID=UPI003520B4CF